ncbi:MAG TPA: peptide deformylase [Acidobacteriaceae bacterium]|nr:peptide deformylase [Acidobacteriaceae bacterium]
MILKIRTAGEPVLRQRARPLAREEIQFARTQELIASMRETMHDAPGVGLAAPQVGVSLQLAVIEDREIYMKDISAGKLAELERKPVPFHVIINPVLSLESEADAEFFEGCLSLPGFLAVVPRARRVRVECLDHDGQPRTIHASGWYARILQHEIDHLLGTVYIDRMRSSTFSSLENYNRHWKDKTIAECRAAPGSAHTPGPKNRGAARGDNGPV